MREAFRREAWEGDNESRQEVESLLFPGTVTLLSPIKCRDRLGLGSVRIEHFVQPCCFEGGVDSGRDSAELHVATGVSDTHQQSDEQPEAAAVDEFDLSELQEEQWPRLELRVHASKQRGRLSALDPSSMA